MSLSIGSEAGRQGFAPTQWSIVIAARDGEPLRARAALSSLCATYWRPLSSFVRRSGYSAEDAQHGLPRTTTAGSTLPDGIFGAETLSAVIAFQRANSLDADGVVGHLTLASLEDSISEQTQFQFVTIFTAIEPGGVRHYLASVPWHVIWHSELRWPTPGGTPVPYKIMKDSRIDVGPVTIGSPRDAALQPILNNPQRPTADYQDEAAVQRAYVDRHYPLIRQFVARPVGLPSDFFQ